MERRAWVGLLAIAWLMVGCDGLSAEEVDDELEGGACATQSERGKMACRLCEVAVRNACADELEASCDEQAVHYESCLDACICDDAEADRDEVECEQECLQLCDVLRGRFLACAKELCGDKASCL